MKDLILIQRKSGFDIFTKTSKTASNYIFNDYIIKPIHLITQNDFNPIIQDYTHLEQYHTVFTLFKLILRKLIQSEGLFGYEYKTKNEDVDESSNGFTIRAELINKSGVFHANFIPRIDTKSPKIYSKF